MKLSKESAQVPTHHPWIYVWLLVLAVMTLYPIIYVGFTTLDDASTAHLLDGGVDTLSTTVYMAKFQGRIGMLWSYPALRLPYIIDSTIWYQSVKLGVLVGICAALGYMLVKIVHSWEVAILAIVLFFALVQNGWDHNALTSYPFAIGFSLALLLLSLALFSSAIEQKRPSLAVTAGLLYFYTLSDESFVLLFPFYILLIFGGKSRAGTAFQRLRSSWLYIFPVLFSLVLYLSLYIIWRIQFPSKYSGNVLNSFDLLQAAKVVATYSLSALPLSSLDFIFSPAHQSLYMDSLGILAIFSGLGAAAYVKPVIVGYLCYWLMSTMMIDNNKKAMILVGVLAALAGVFIPNLLLGFNAKYQDWVASGSASYLYTFYSFISFIVFLVFLVVLLNLVSRSWPVWCHRLALISVSLLLALLTFVVDARNHFVSLDQKLAHRKWQLMEWVVDSTAFSEVGAGSVIVAPTLAAHQRGIAATPLSIWSAFVKRKTGKEISFVADECMLNAPCFSLVFQQEAHSDNQFVIFGKVIDSDHTVSSDLFVYSFPGRVKNTIIGRYKSNQLSPFLRVDGKTVNNIASGSFAVDIKSTPARDFISSTHFIGNIDIYVDEIIVSNYKNKLQFNPLAIEFGKGFYGWENSPDEPAWSWGREISELKVLNSGERMSAMLTLEVTTLESVGLTFSSAPEQDFTVVPGKWIEIRTKLDLMPGNNIVTIISDRPAIKPAEGDDRLLSFAVRNIKIRPEKL